MKIDLSQTKLIIFDLDGTLVDSRQDLIFSVNAMLRELGRAELPPDTIAGYVGYGAAQLVASALGTQSGAGERAQALEIFLKVYEEHKLDSTRAYPGVPETCRRLQQFMLAVLTNKPVSMSNAILDGLRLSQYFRVVYGGDSFASKKPGPEGANAILREFGMAAQQALFVGDSEVDVQTARNAGMPVAAVNFGFGTHDREKYPADVYLERMTELVGLLGAAEN